MVSVTQELNRNRQTYGGGGSSDPTYLAISKNLNFAAKSNSILNASVERVTVIPYISNYKDSIGLFGAENIFIKVQLDVKNTLQINENGVLIFTYEDAIQGIDTFSNIYWEQAYADYNNELVSLNDYDPAVFTNKLDIVPGAVVKVDLENLKTGNKYIDAWFDVRLYQKNKLEHIYTTMYVPVGEYFYIGFHARNTKRLPYNVRLTINGELFSKYNLSKEQSRYLIS